MPSAVFYRPIDGAILGLVQTSDSASLLLNATTDRRMILVSETHPIWTAQHQWRVDPGAAQLERKTQVVLTADKPVFLADGVDTVRITATGLTGPASARVRPDDRWVAFAPIDPVLQITADTPKRFIVQIQDERYWSDPVVVEAV